MILISSCLVGVNCRYNGSNSLNKDLEKLVLDGKAIALCPELLGNLPTPRESCEIIISKEGEQRILSSSGEDFTKAFRDGAEKTLQMCKIAGVKQAILQSRSPSCGYGKIYDGTFSGKLIPGNGFTAELLSKNGIEILTEENYSPSQ